MTPFAQHIADLDTTDLPMIGDCTIDHMVRDYGLVSFIELAPIEGTETRCVADLTIQADLSIHFSDGSVPTIRTIIKGSDEDGIIGIRSMTRLAVPC